MNFRLSGRHDWQRIRDYVASLSWQRPKLDSNSQAILGSSGAPVMAGIQYRVTIEEVKSKRTLEQNARLWALYTEISKISPDYMGGEWHSPEVWHRYCQTRFLGMESGPFGTGVPKSTAKLKVAEFGDYMSQIEAWAQDQFPGWSFDYEAAA
ncbi:Recombinase NinB [uncultured Caudovirales phage]|uniref:Recombinase NinB n=1 Tax=uncultured Caudovirales phage TaxID=2100421 RepID=A0A6J5R3H7_9CAUD|nr:Recombinase NinB [uncultured Caudovirales phage]